VNQGIRFAHVSFTPYYGIVADQACNEGGAVVAANRFDNMSNAAPDVNRISTPSSWSARCLLYFGSSGAKLEGLFLAEGELLSGRGLLLPGWQTGAEWTLVFLGKAGFSQTALLWGSFGDP